MKNNDRNSDIYQYYNYIESGYVYTSIHRRIVAYDPRNSSNEIIKDAFNTIVNKKNHRDTLFYLMYLELLKYNNPILPEIPVSYQMVLHEINMAWSDLVNQMIFKDQLFDTFYAEYYSLLNNILIHDTPFSKETLVYRYYLNGDSLFHLAAKVRLIQIKKDFEDSKELPNEINKELSHILICYIKLGRCFGPGMGDCILSIKDFSGKKLKQYLIDFCIELYNGEES